MRAAIILAAGLALAGCQTSKDMSGTIESVVTPENVRLACEATTLAYAIFEAAGTDQVKPATLTKIRAGYASVAAVCAAPPSNTVEAMGAAIAAVRAFRVEIEKAKAS